MYCNGCRARVRGRRMIAPQASSLAGSSADYRRAQSRTTL
ncbi:Uncharacterized protein ChrSV_2486 [Chromobacterium vaccinii]|nr:Uncharacterized protein ChrSW_2486 [Chromobacterium vaccinii]QND89943.1 Uncharacterized protein ChrSV_2486 [Chromobacterium vaccinii]